MDSFFNNKRILDIVFSIDAIMIKPNKEPIIIKIIPNVFFIGSTVDN